MATLTLTRMAEGGLYDQLGGGFARYSVDGAWMIPHFEKMLYDNGQLLSEYARAHLATGEPLFAKVANETADWLLRDMRSPAGGFYSSLDADSEGHEGKFYAWTRNEIQSLLTLREYSAFSARFGLDRAANFEGAWHLHTYASLDDIAGALGESTPAVLALIESSRSKLLQARNLRVWPARDEKILTVMERADDQGAGDCLARAGAPRPSGSRRRGRGFRAPPPVARRPPAGDLQGRPRAPARLSR